MSKPMSHNPQEGRLGLTQQVVRRTNPHLNHKGIPGTNIVSTILEYRDDLVFPFHGEKRRAKSKKKESLIEDGKIELDELEVA